MPTVWFLDALARGPSFLVLFLKRHTEFPGLTLSIWLTGVLGAPELLNPLTTSNLVLV